ncbi:proteasome complex subunit Rpn13 ubiquitin receptor-domain-containing protein [Pilaira anomala]|nr:proteasome complex subunit Rpn13 ubiquitin receptor-domain-containing protein [Pilaira anomala]
MSLFPTTQRNNHLVEFNAGKCIREGDLLKPDTRKGVIYMDQSDDQLMHFYWKERKSSEPEDDFIIFPDEAELLRVDQCTTGRVYILKFKSSSQKVFYWMQSKKSEKDEELVKRVNQLINDPQSAHQEGNNSRESDLEFEDNAHSDLMQILSGNQDDLENMTQDNLLQFIQDAGNLGHLSSALPSNGHVLANSQWTELKSKLDHISIPEGQSAVAFEQVSNKDALATILKDDQIRSALFPFISSEQQQDLDQLIQSQPFKERLQLLKFAIQQDELNFIIQELEIEKDLKAFLKAVEEQAKHKADAMEED